MVDTPTKGLPGGTCNVTACQAPGALFYNNVMDAYYCEHCAVEIDRYSGGLDLFTDLPAKRRKLHDLLFEDCRDLEDLVPEDLC